MCFDTDAATVWARYALNWYQLGFLNEDDKGAAFELVSLASYRWANQFCGSLRHISFTLHSSFESPLLYQSNEFDEDEEGETSKCLFLSFEPEQCWTFTMEDKLGKLHELHPELAETTLHWLGMIGGRLLNIWTPLHARWVAEYVWWFGETDEKDFQESLEAYYDGENPDDTFGPGSWKDAFPHWVYEPKAVLDVETLRNISMSQQDPWVAEIAEVVAALAEVPEVGLKGPNDWGLDHVYQAATMRWNEDDPLLRLTDDVMQHANESGDGYCGQYAIECLPEDPEAFKQKVSAMSRALEQITQLDRLIDLIADIT